MTITPKRLVQGTLVTTSAVAYYTAPADTTAVIKKLTFVNTHTAALTLTVYLVKTGESVAAKHLLVSARTLAPSETFDCYEALLHVLEAGDSIQALASTTNKITISASGVEVT